MSHHDTDPQIKAWKQDAWDLKKASIEKLSHAQALDKIAHREGYPNWMRLLDAHRSGTCPVS